MNFDPRKIFLKKGYTNSSSLLSKCTLMDCIKRNCLLLKTMLSLKTEFHKMSLQVEGRSLQNAK